MAILFLLVRLNIKREVISRDWSSFRRAWFPIISALGGVVIPALIFLLINKNTVFSQGIGIPVSIDIMSLEDREWIVKAEKSIEQ